MTSQPCGPSRTAPSAVLVIVRGRRMEIALDLGAREEGGDARGVVKGVVEREDDVGHLAQLDHARHPPLQKNRAALQPGHDLSGIGAGKRHDERGGVAQVGADPHLSHRDAGVTQRRIAQLAGPQQLGQHMAQLFPDAQLPLAGRGGAGGITVASSGHGLLPYRTAFPAKAGIHRSANSLVDEWVPAFAGTAVNYKVRATSSTSKHSITSPIWMFS